MERWNSILQERRNKRGLVPTGTLEGPMTGDLMEKVELEANIAQAQGLSRAEGAKVALAESARLAEVDDVINEPFRLAPEGLGEMTREEKLQLEGKLRNMKPADQPPYFPHLRKAHDWDERYRGDADSGQQAATHFFSQKSWSQVDGISKDVLETVRKLALPKPSKIQYGTFRDVSEGRNIVIGDAAGSGKTMAYLLPLLQRHVLHVDPDDHTLKILIIAPTSDLAQQIVNVARLISFHSKRRFRVHCFTGGTNLRPQNKNLQGGCEVAVFTPGKLRFYLFEDEKQVLDTSGVRAIVFDEVDVLVQPESWLSLEDVRRKVDTYFTQWVFVTATLSNDARTVLKDFEALPSVTPPAGKDSQTPKRGLKWKKGGGLHKVNPNCEHVLVDCSKSLADTRRDWANRSQEGEKQQVMQRKVLTLVWHLRHGVLSDTEENRIVIFCNTIPNCQMLENELRKRDEQNQRTKRRNWKVMVLHGARSREDYAKIAESFSSDRASAADWYKKKVLICTDRLSRGMDFGQQAVDWVVLFDWPRDATEYLRRVGRTARGTCDGSVLSLLGSVPEISMAKKITAAAIQNLPLESGGNFPMESGVQTVAGKRRICLERFDPQARDWRSPEATDRKPWEEKKDDEDEDLALNPWRMSSEKKALLGLSDQEPQDVTNNARYDRKTSWNDDVVEQPEEEADDEEVAAAWGTNVEKEEEDDDGGEDDVRWMPWAEEDDWDDKETWGEEFLDEDFDIEEVVTGKFGVSLDE